jgi:uroporphyrinogen-III decarboxylase
MYLHAGLDPVTFWYTSEGIAEAFIRMTDLYRFDGINVNIPGRDPTIARGVVTVEDADQGHMITWKNGYREFVPCDDAPFVPVEMRKPVRHRTIDDIEPDEIPLVHAESELPEYYFDILDRVISARGAELSIHGEVGTTFERFLNLFGSTEDGLMALLDDPGKSTRIMGNINQTVLVEALAQSARGVDAMKLSSPFAGSGFISRGMYETFVLPFEKAVISAVNAHHGIPCYVHTCGAIGDRLDLIVATGTQGIECLDPFPLGDVDLEMAIGQIGDRVFIKGNLDSVNELLSKPESEVRHIARKRIALGTTCRKGYILSSACSVAPRVPVRNIQALQEVAREMG